MSTTVQGHVSQLDLDLHYCTLRVPGHLVFQGRHAPEAKHVLLHAFYHDLPVTAEVRDGVLHTAALVAPEAE